jgi:hypothetical protein
MKYTLRAIKYLIRLVLLLVVIFLLMRWSGTSNISTEGGILDFFAAFIATSRGKILLTAIVVWSAIYPAVEFKTRHLGYDLSERQSAIIRALHAGGMTNIKGNDNWMVFAGSLLRRIWWLGDDAVTITRSPEGGIDIEGPRRFVMEAQHRIPRYVEADYNQQ